MRELKPYQTLQGMRTAIDNGGRFYNLSSAADDQVVSKGELAKAAGVFTAGMQAFLFFEMAQQELSPADRQAVADLLDDTLKKRYRRHRPVALLPSAVETEASAGQAVMVAGYPRFLEKRSEFRGIIIIPVGKVFVPIPIFKRFDVYEVFDDNKMQKPNCVVATARGHRLAHDGPIRFGGVLRKLRFQGKSKAPYKFYLETVFYTKL